MKLHTTVFALDEGRFRGACIDCNLGKSSNLSGRDPDTGTLTALFDPRTQDWDDHFEQRGPLIVGKTDVGRTTVYVLNMNSEDQVERRRQSWQ